MKRGTGLQVLGLSTVLVVLLVAFSYWAVGEASSLPVLSLNRLLGEVDAATSFWRSLSLASVLLGFITLIVCYIEKGTLNSVKKVQNALRVETMILISKLNELDNSLKVNFQRSETDQEVKKCPFCRKNVLSQFRICPYCGEKLPYTLLQI